MTDRRTQHCRPTISANNHHLPVSYTATIRISNEKSFSSLLLQFVQIIEVQKRPIVHYSALYERTLDVLLQYYTAVWIHLNEHVNSSFNSSQHKYTQLDTSETSSHNVISLCSVVSSLIINAM